MADARKMRKLPQIPPPQTRIVDGDGRMTKEFYDYLLRLSTVLAAQLEASLRKQ